eukprot:1140820-Pelagomonas_calceolata.AAC.2
MGHIQTSSEDVFNSLQKQAETYWRSPHLEALLIEFFWTNQALPTLEQLSRPCSQTNKALSSLLKLALRLEQLSRPSSQTTWLKVKPQCNQFVQLEQLSRPSSQTTWLKFTPN